LKQIGHGLRTGVWNCTLLCGRRTCDRAGLYA
jgi:hypothetical protein